MERKIESYLATDDDGKEYRIDVFREVIERFSAGVKQRVDGKVFHRLENGNHVNIHKDGMLEDFVTGTKMRRIKNS